MSDEKLGTSSFYLTSAQFQLNRKVLQIKLPIFKSEVLLEELYK